MMKSGKYIGLFLMILSGAAHATKNMTLNGSTNKDGGFNYSLTVHNDPFFTHQTVGFYLTSFSNLISVSTSTEGWALEQGAHHFGLTHNFGSVERPYTVSCVAESGLNSYKVVPTTSSLCAIAFGDIGWREETSGEGTVTSANVVFYAKMKAIVPCDIQEHDGSAPLCIDTVKLIPDILIDDVLITNNTVMGLSYCWGSSNTMLVQASSDMNAWTNVAYARGGIGTNNWFHTEPLSDYGEYYRIQLVAQRWLDPLPAVNLTDVSFSLESESLVEDAGEQEISISGITPEGILVHAAVESGSSYELRVTSTENGQVFYRKNIYAESDSIACMIEHAFVPDNGSIELQKL